MRLRERLTSHEVGKRFANSVLDIGMSADESGVTKIGKTIKPHLLASCKWEIYGE